jgi:hypothetical protein
MGFAAGGELLEAGVTAVEASLVGGLFAIFTGLAVMGAAAWLIYEACS